MAAIRIGVVGTGHFGRFHALKLAARGCLSGLRNVDAARAAAVSAETGAPVLSEAELIARSDAVVVAVPTAHHHACGMRVLEAGRHLLVEKPMATSVAEAEALVEAAARRRPRAPGRPYRAALGRHPHPPRERRGEQRARSPSTPSASRPSARAASTSRWCWT